MTHVGRGRTGSESERERSRPKRMGCRVKRFGGNEKEREFSKKTYLGSVAIRFELQCESRRWSEPEKPYHVEMLLIISREQLIHASVQL